jgi:hypothetical protein
MHDSTRTTLHLLNQLNNTLQHRLIEPKHTEKHIDTDDLKQKGMVGGSGRGEDQEQQRHHARICLIGELLLLVRLDDDVGGGVGGAGEHPPGANLVVVQEALVGLVHGAGDHLAGAGGAGPRAARVGQVDPFLLCLVKDVHVVGNLELHLAVRRDELDVVGGLSPQPGAARHGGGGKRHGGRRWRRGHAEGEGRSAEAAEDGGHCCFPCWLELEVEAARSSAGRDVGWVAQRVWLLMRLISPQIGASRQSIFSHQFSFPFNFLPSFI